MYYTSIILSIFCFYTIPMSYTGGTSPAAMRMQRLFVSGMGIQRFCYREVGFWWGGTHLLLWGYRGPLYMGWGCRDPLQRGRVLAGAGLTCCYKDVEVHCTLDGDGWVYRGLGIWVGRNSPAAIRMQGSFRSSVSGAPTWDSGFTEGCSMNICRTKRRTELQQYNSPRYMDRNRISFVDIVHVCCEI